MKKTAILSLICLLTAVLFFAGCDLLADPFPEETETESSILIDPDKTQPETEAPLTPEEEALVEMTNPENLRGLLKILLKIVSMVNKRVKNVFVKMKIANVVATKEKSVFVVAKTANALVIVIKTKN